MLESEKKLFKSGLIAALAGTLHAAIASLKEEIRFVQESANEETKSSSGDKYETGRAMAHLEVEKLMSQLADKQNTLSLLEKLSRDALRTKVEPGSVVITPSDVFFIGIQAGAIDYGGHKVTSVSSGSPLGRALNGATAGTSINVNGREIIINTVF